MSLFLGVDGGQTSTRVVIGDAGGKIVAAATGGPSNHTEEPGGPERLRNVVTSTVGEALSQLNVQFDSFSFAAACLGMTGELKIKQRIIEGIVRTPHLSVVHDPVIALAGGTAGRPGLIVIAGTGSVALGRDAQGKVQRVGGWGHLFGDEGSAYCIGRAAVRVLLAAHEGTGEESALSGMLSSRLGFATPYDLMDLYYSGEYSRQHLASLSVWVDEAAQAGDGVAAQILTAAGRDLARMALVILSLLFRPDGQATGSEKPIISYSGGAFRSDILRQAFMTAIHEKDAGALIAAPRFPPELGALLLAYNSAGVPLSDEAMKAWA